MSGVPAVPDSDDELGGPAFGPQLPTAAAGSTNPFPAGSPGGSPSSFDAMMRQMMETTQAAVQALSLAAASSTKSESHAITGREMSKILPKPEPFKAGSRESECSTWPAWLWALEQYLGVLDPAFSEEISQLKLHLDTPVDPSSTDTLVRSKQLYAMLSVLIKGRGFLLVKSISNSNGYEALRQLIALYAPQSKARSLGILTALTQVAAFKTSEALMPQVLDLERVFSEYETSSQQLLQEELKTALLVRCLPNNIKNQLNAALPEDASYAQVRETVFRIERQQFKWQGVAYFNVANTPEPVPMEIDAVTKGGQGKGKGKGKGSKSQGKSKGKGDGGKQGKSGQGKGKNDKGGQSKGKNGKGGKGKSKSSGKGQSSNPAANVICHNCQKPGHYARDCWSPKVINQVETPRSPAPSSVGPSASQVAGPSASQVSTHAPASQQPSVRRIEIDMTSLVSGGGSLNAVVKCEPLSASRKGFAVCNASQAAVSHEVVAHPPGLSSEFMNIAMQLQASLGTERAHELQAIEPEHFDMAYSDADPDWCVPIYQPLNPRPEPLGLDHAPVRFRPEPFISATRATVQRFATRRR